jgi:hypothetical protein
VGEADAARQDRHGRRTTFVANAHLACGGASPPWCPITGEPAPEAGFPHDVPEMADAATQVLIHPGPEAGPDEIRAAVARASELLGDAAHPCTAQIATASVWAEAFSPGDLERALSEASERGVAVLSDGVRPALHPALGEESATRWKAAWRAAAVAGQRGQATVLYGPDFDLDAVFTQLDAIRNLQEECGVFDAVSPIVHRAEGFGGATDALATQAREDIRVLAACRLALDNVEHLRIYYECTDLKSAHTSLLCGVDDLEGHLFLGSRDKRTDAESNDLSLAEMSRWLEEVGLEAHLRDGLYRSRPVPMQSSASSS